MKVKLRALRGLKNTQLYGRVSGGQVFEVDPYTAAQLVKQGSAEYVGRPPETDLPVKPPAPPEPAPEWTLRTSPENYIKKHGGKKNPSDAIKANLELAYQIVGK